MDRALIHPSPAAGEAASIKAFTQAVKVILTIITQIQM